jgi:hypothetical protein
MSPGTQAFIRAHRAFDDRGDRLTLRNVPVHVRRIFDIVGVSELLDLD